MSKKPAWLEVAERYIGTKEYPGAGNNPVILQWASKTARFLGISYKQDSVPWCGLFTAFCINEVGLVPVKVAVRASEWAKFGVAVREPVLGAIAVFTREGGGHVGFVVGHDADALHVLGGNQSDAVNVQRIAKSRCSAMRYPAGLPTPRPLAHSTLADSRLSTNEA
jgi:uncharacterized protein (TIGR02594 family)